MMKKNLSKKTILLFLLVNYLAFAKAQYPVQIIPQLVSPYTLNLSEYYTGTTPKLFVTLTNRDLQRPVANVRLRMSITGQLASIFTSEFVTYPTIALYAGVPQRLSMNDLAPYFNPNNLDFTGSLTKVDYLKQNKLPEGFYSFCFQAVEVNTNKIVSENTCSNVWISLSDPPLLNTPTNGALVAKTDPTNILFNWTPRHLNSPNGAFNTDYDFELKEIWDNAVDPQAAFQTASIFYSTTTQATSVLYGPSQPILIPGKKYAWRVRSKARNITDDRDDFKNNGYSDVFWFVYKENCLAPTNTNAIIQANNAVDFTWLNANGIVNDFVVEYRNTGIGSTIWMTTKVSNANLLTIWNLQLGATFEYRVGTACNATTTIYSDIKQITMPPPPPVVNAKIRGTVLWAYYNNGEEVDNTNSIPLVKSENITCNQTGVYPINRDTSSKKNPFEKVTVSLYKADGTLIAQTESGKMGNYRLEFDSAILKTLDSKLDTALYIILSKPNAPFNDIKIGIARTGSHRMPDLATVYRRVMYIKSFEINPRVKASNYDLAIKGNFSIDYLVSESNFNRVYRNVATMIGVDTTKTIIYNGVKHYIVATVTNGSTYKKLLQTYYSARLNCNGSASQYEPYGEGSSLTTDFKYTTFFRNYCFYFTNKIEGTINFRGAARNQATVTITTQPTDFATTNTGATVFTTTTDEKGYYSFDNMPMLKEGVILKISVKDNSIRLEPFEDTMKVTSWATTKNMTLVNNIYTFVGRLVDQNKQAVANAQISIDGTVLTQKTTKDGYYIFKTTYNENKVVTFSADKYTTNTLKLSKYKLVDLSSSFIKNSNPSAWEQLLRASSLKSVEKTIYVRDDIDERRWLADVEVTADLLGIGTGRLLSNYPNYINENIETLLGIADGKTTTLQSSNGLLKLKIFKQSISKTTGENINITTTALITITQLNDAGNVVVSDGAYGGAQVFTYVGTPGKYSYKIKPDPQYIAQNGNFAEQYGEFTLQADEGDVSNATSITVYLKNAVEVRGTIVSRKDGKKLDASTITVEGFNTTATTDKEGNFIMYLPQGQYFFPDEPNISFNSYKFSIRRAGFTSLDTTINCKLLVNNFTVNINPFDERCKPVSTLSGFAVVLDKQTFEGAGKSKISGQLTVTSNSAFSMYASNNKLTFKNILVTIDDKGNAVPSANVVFEESVMPAKAFDFAPVEVTGLQRLQLRAWSGTDFSAGVIGGDKVTMKASSINNISPMPVAITDAIFIDKSLAANNNFYKIFIAPNYNSNDLTASKTFSLNFANPSVAASVDGYLETYVIPKTALLIKKDSASINKDGISLSGYLQFPKSLSSADKNNGKLAIQKFTFGKTFSISELSFTASESKPILIPVQKIKLNLTKVTLSGLGTANVGIDLAGEVWLKKREANATNKDGVLKVISLSLKKENDDVTMAGSFSLPPDGLSVKNLLFKTGDNQTIDMSYDFTNKNFTFRAAGSIKYNARSTDSILANTFAKPIEIQEFRLNTKNWGVFLAAKPNIELDYKVTKIIVSRLLINVGYSISFDAMNKYLMENKPAAEQENVSDTAAFDEAKGNWAIGFAGSAKFVIDGMGIKGEASVLVASINNAIKAQVNKLSLSINKAPTFTFAAEVTMQFNSERQGFSAKGQLEIMSKGLKADLEYYQYSTGGIILKANLDASLGNQGVITGPITWFGIGGGFEYNTVDGIYAINLRGQVTATGTPKDAAYVDITKLGILFDAKKCSGSQPVFQATGDLYLKNEIWGSMDATFDFCLATMLVTVKGQVPLLKKMSKIEVDGILYGVAPTNGNDGALFLSVNANVGNLLAGLASGNAFFALGINYDNNKAAPNVIKNVWSKIPDVAKEGSKFNAVFASVSIDMPNKSGKFDAKIVTADYSISGCGNGTLYYKFSDNTFGVTANLECNVSGSACLIGLCARGSAGFKASLAGGNDGSWYFKGRADAYARVTVGNGPPECNDWCLVSCQGFTICISVGVGFDYRQGSGCTISL